MYCLWFILFQLWWPFIGVTLTIYVKLLCPHVQENELNWLLGLFKYSSYVVISVLKAFQVAPTCNSPEEYTIS